MTADAPDARQGPDGGPIPGSYWIVPGRLAAGPRPVVDDDGGRASYAGLSETGVDVVIDLAGDGSNRADGGRAPVRGTVTVRRHPIPDFAVPTESVMRAILEDIDRALESEQVVYVHCVAGVGRTGTVVGCWIVQHGMARPEDAIDTISRLRTQAGLPPWRSPETTRQRQLVESWTPST